MTFSKSSLSIPIPLTSFRLIHRRAVRQDELVNTKLMTSNDNYSVKVPKSTRLSEYFEDFVKAATVWYVNLPQIWSNCRTCKIPTEVRVSRQCASTEGFEEETSPSLCIHQTTTFRYESMLCSLSPRASYLTSCTLRLFSWATPPPGLCEDVNTSHTRCGRIHYQTGHQINLNMQQQNFKYGWFNVSLIS